MREALSGVTFRGRCFLAAAAATAASALLLGEKDLIRIALLLAVLPLIAIFVVTRVRYRITCTRTLTPRRVSVDSEAGVELRIENLSRIPSDTMLLEEHLPPELGPNPRLVLERLSTRNASTVTYTVRADHRGRYPLGPLIVEVSDPFRMCTLRRVLDTTDHLTVIPAITALPELNMAGEYVGSGENRSRAVAVHGHDDVATREYRHGDDLRRVHWRSTARTGELMVRREEQPWESKATIILDARAAAHHSHGQDSSFEWMVSAAASISLHLRQAHYKLRFLADDGTDIEASELDGEDALLTYLAEVQPRPRRDMYRLAESIRHRFDDGIVIALLGKIGPEETRLLSGLRRAGSTCIAFMPDSDTWEKSAARRTVDEQGDEAAAVSLLQTGWRVITVERGANLATLWPRTARRDQGFAFRAALAETISPAVNP